jgi:hypothetical protein
MIGGILEPCRRRRGSATRRPRCLPASGAGAAGGIQLICTRLCDMARELKLPVAPGRPRFSRFGEAVAGLSGFAAALKRLGRLPARGPTNARRWALARMAPRSANPTTWSPSTMSAWRSRSAVLCVCAWAAERHGPRARASLHVAQSQYHDISVARKLGLRCAGSERRKGLKGSAERGRRSPGPTITSARWPSWPMRWMRKGR